MVLRRPINFDDLLKEVEVKVDGITFINDLDYFSEMDKDILENKTKDELKEGSVSILPSCSCGGKNEEWNLGTVCEICDTIVMHRIKDFNPDLWAEIPEGFENWISPSFLKRLEVALHVSHRHLFRWMGDRSNNPMIKGVYFGNLKPIDTLQSIEGFERSYLYFINNIPLIISTIIGASTDAQSNKRLIGILAYYEEFKDKIFSKNIPIISKRFLIMETGNKGKHAFKETLAMSEMANSLLSAFTTGRKIEGRITKFLQSYSELKTSFESNVIGGKHGLFKENLLGMRSIFSCRNVITAIDGRHRNDEIILPWGSMVTMFKPFIFSALRRKGYRYNKMKNLWSSSILNYNKEIDDILHDLCRQSKGHFGCLLLRNPAQSNYGTINMKCFRWKTNPNDPSISVPSQMVGFGNGDFDGDQEAVFLAIDKYMKEAFKKLAPIHSVAGGLIGTVFGKVTTTKTMTSIIGNRINEERKCLGV